MGTEVAQGAAKAIAAGSTTTEYKLTKFLVGFGSLLTTASAVLGFLPQGSKSISIAGIVVGALLAILSKLGYVASRTAIKTAAAAALLFLLVLPAPARAQTLTAIPSGTATIGKVTLNWGPVTGIDVFNVGKNSAGKSVLQYATQASAGGMIDLGFGPDVDGQPRWHLSLPAMFGGGVQATTAIASFTTGLLFGWGGFGKVPLFAIGPGVNVPLNSTAAPSFQFLATVAAVNLITPVTGS